MAGEKLQLEIVTPERMVVELQASEVILPGVDGSFGVLPGHAPMLTGLAPGVAVCKCDGKEEVMAISSGFAEVMPHRVIVLAETCELAEDIDESRASRRVGELEGILAAARSDDDLDAVAFRLKKHMARLNARRR